MKGMRKSVSASGKPARLMKLPGRDSILPWQDTVRDEFTREMDDENPVLGPLEKLANEHYLANEVISDHGVLLDYLSLFFKASVVGSVELFLKGGEDSWVGCSMVSTQGTYASYVKKVIQDILLSNEWDRPEIGKAREVSDGGDAWTEAVEEGDSNTGAASESHTGEVCQVGEVSDPGGPWIEVTAKRHRSRGKGLQIDGGDRDGDEDDLNDYGDDTKGRGRFCNLVPILIHLGPFVTPEKLRGAEAGRTDTNRQRTLSIRDRSYLFVQDEAVRGCVPNFSPGSGDEDGNDVFLFHGTRSRNLTLFRRFGISPGSHVSDFSRVPTFYVGNSARYAFEHPLLNHAHPHGRETTCDRTVSVLCFKVPVEVLRGEKPPRSNQTAFEVCFFPDANDAWLEFCKNNWSTLGNEKVYRQFDITIGPISTPGVDQDGTLTYRKVSRTRCSPLQIAFSTHRARMWLAHHLVHIFEESRA